MATGVKMQHVPYKGTGPASLALLGGEVQLGFNNVQTLLQNVRAGQLRALAVAEPQRMPMLPDIPAVAETVPGFSMAPWIGIIVPVKTPKEVVSKLGEATLAMMRDPEVIKLLVEQQITPDALGRGRIREADQIRSRPLGKGGQDCRHQARIAAGGRHENVHTPADRLAHDLSSHRAIFPSAARLCPGAGSVRPARRHDDGQHIRGCDQLQGPHLRAPSRAGSADGVRPNRQIHPRDGRGLFRPAAWASHRCAGQHLDHRRPLAHRLQDEPGRPHPQRARRARQCRRDARVRASAAVRRADRHRVRTGGRHLRDAGPRQGRFQGRQVRQGRQLHQDLGQARLRSRRIQHRAFDRGRPRRTSPRRGPQQCPHPGVRRRRQVYPRVQASRPAVRPVHHPRSDLCGWRTAIPARS